MTKAPHLTTRFTSFRAHGLRWGILPRVAAITFMARCAGTSTCSGALAPTACTIGPTSGALRRAREQRQLVLAGATFSRCRLARNSCTYRCAHAKRVPHPCRSQRLRGLWSHHDRGPLDAGPHCRANAGLRLQLRRYRERGAVVLAQAPSPLQLAMVGSHRLPWMVGGTGTRHVGGATPWPRPCVELQAPSSGARDHRVGSRVSGVRRTRVSVKSQDEVLFGCNGTPPAS